jgi:glucosamine 6-phosphate synthetase-like amidotransferase/phosphosugar isomerase protein
MCGIAGFSIAPGEQINATILARSLLLGIEARGRHATGAAWSDSEGVLYQKSPVRASLFVWDLAIEQATTSAILHTRNASVGCPSNSRNNHPIVLPGIVGVHNGRVTNDDDVFAALRAELGVERQADVDSESIFALLAAADDLGITQTEALEHLAGRSAAAWINVNTPNEVHVARLQQYPVWLGQTAAGSTLFASTIGAIQSAASRCGLVIDWSHEIPEGSHYTLNGGRIDSVANFEPLLPRSTPARSDQRTRRTVAMVTAESQAASA